MVACFVAGSQCPSMHTSASSAPIVPASFAASAASRSQVGKTPPAASPRNSAFSPGISTNVESSVCGASAWNARTGQLPRSSSSSFENTMSAGTMTTGRFPAYSLRMLSCSAKNTSGPSRRTRAAKSRR